MSAVELVAAALATGAAAGLTDTVSAAVRDTYTGLLSAVRRTLGRGGQKEAVVDEHAADPAGRHDELVAALAAADAGQDADLVAAARRLLTQIDPASVQPGKDVMELGGPGTRARSGADGEGSEKDGSRNTISGHVAGPAIQAAVIHGGLHLHNSSTSAVSPVATTNLPPRNPSFTGRAAQLAALDDQLAAGRVAVVAVRGLGGIGKSQLALEHAHALAVKEAAYGPNHPDVAMTLNTLGAVYHDLGDLLAARHAVQRALSSVEAADGPDHSDRHKARRLRDQLGG